MKLNRSSLKSLIFLSIILVLSLVYAFIRYNIFKEPVTENNFLYVTNKAIAITAIISLAMAYVVSNLKRLGFKIKSSNHNTKKYFGVYGFFLSAIHILITLFILSPVIFGKFFTGDELNLKGLGTILFGAFGFIVFILPAIATIPKVAKTLGVKKWLTLQRYGYAGLFFVVFHLLVMGFSGWFDTSHWPGGLVPISLLSVITPLFALSLKGSTLLVEAFTKKPILNFIFTKYTFPKGNNLKSE